MQIMIVPLKCGSDINNFHPWSFSGVIDIYLRANQTVIKLIIDSWYNVGLTTHIFGLLRNQMIFNAVAFLQCIHICRCILTSDRW